MPLTGVWDAGHQGNGVRRGAQWYLRSGVSAGPSHVPLAFGRSTDQPLAGDWDRNGVDEPGVRRGAQWFLARGFRDATQVTALSFGSPVQVPVVGDWDGNGSDTSGTTELGNSYWRNDHKGGSPTYTGKVLF